MTIPTQTTQATTNDVGSRSSVSPIGTTSPNSGSAANTNSTYAPGAFTTGLAVLDPSITAYTVQNTDYQGTIQFNTASACTATLNGSVRTNFICQIMNLSTGTITLTPNSGYLVNGSASITLLSGQGAIVGFANRAWTAFVGGAPIPVVPQTIAPVAGKYLTSYDATTGVFTENATAGISVTITTAALTALGTQGSQTFVNGLLTAQVQAT
jgi:hypothetical protein